MGVENGSGAARKVGSWESMGVTASKITTYGDAIACLCMIGRCSADGALNELGPTHTKERRSYEFEPNALLLQWNGLKPIN